MANLDLSLLPANQQIAAIYIGYYDRAGDPFGSNFWETAVDNPAFSLEDIASDFAVQDETLENYSFFETQDPAEAPAFITALYLNLFNRPPEGPDDVAEGEEDGLTFWSDALVAAIDGTGELSVGEIILAIIQGAEDTAEFSDRTTILNKIEVATAWTDAAEAAGLTGEGDYLADADAQASAKSIIEGVDATSGTVTSAKSTIADFFAPEPVEGDQIFLTSGTDRGEDFTGTANDDDFLAYIQQNPFAGGVSNSLSSADQLDGGAGYDSLYAEIVNEFVGAGGFVAPDIQPRTTSIEEALFEARELFDQPNTGGLLGASLGQIVDAKWMFGLEKIGSSFSDASLKIENLTTLASDGVTIRNTEDLTIVMDHTENTNSSEGERASDLTVLFDEDYLVAGQTTAGEAQFFLLDQDAELRLLDGNPATTAEGRLDEIDKNGIRFQIGDDAPVTISFADELLEEANASEINDHDAFILALQADLQAKIAAGEVPAGTQIVREDNNFQIILDDDGLPLNRASLQDGSFSELIPGIKVISGNGAVVTPLGFSAPDELPGEFNVFGRFDNDFETTINPITINVDLEKAGRAGQGGDLIIGGKELTAGGDGIEVFKVNVIGDSTKPSWITNLNSTNDELDTIMVATDAAFAGSGDVADLTISEIGGASVNNGSDETDVRIFNATAFEGDFTGYANLDEFGGGAHSYLLGGGDDSLSLLFGDTNFNSSVGGGDSGDNITFGGAAGDSLTVNTGAGDDTLRLDSASGNATTSPTTNGGGGADLEFLNIETGSGDDTVFYDTDNANIGPNVRGTDTTTGDGARISTSEGEDNIYMNDGTSSFVELSLIGDGDIDTFQLFGASIQVEIDGVLSEWVDVEYDRATYTTSREDIRDAALAAIEQSTALSDMVEIVELADGTVQLRSLVSGTTNWNFNVEGPVASEALIDASLATGSEGGEDEPAGATPGTGWPLLNAQSTLNQVNLTELSAAWSAWYPESTAFDPTSPVWTSDSAADFLGAPDVTSVATLLNALDVVADFGDTTGTLTGPTGNNSDDNVINAGANDDLIALSASAVGTEAGTVNEENGNGNTVEFTGTFGWDTIVNFTSDGTATTVDGQNNNDVMDFTSYLDMAAHVRGTSVGNQTLRVDEAVDYSFINLMGGDSGATVVDHNQIRLMEFSELWTDLNAAPASSAPPVNFDSVTATHVDTWLEENMSNAVRAGTGASPTGVGNEFVILIGKDGDIEINPIPDPDTVAFDANHADNQFWAFKAIVDSYNAAATDNNFYDFSVNFLGGVDLAETAITGLSPDDFGVMAWS